MNNCNLLDRVRNCVVFLVLDFLVLLAYVYDEGFSYCCGLTAPIVSICSNVVSSYWKQQ